MKKISLILLSGIFVFSAWSQNSFPSDSHVIINSGNLTQSGNYNLQTQGAVKLKNYLLFDSDGDFTGGNYFTIQQDASGDFLRFGRSFQSNLVIANTGYVGIGVTSPSKELQVKGVVDFISTSNGNNFIHFDYASNGNKVRSYGTNLLLETRNSTEKIEFRTNNSETFLMTVMGNGKVGIGNSTPLYLLDVAGDARFVKSDNSGLLVSGFSGGLTDVPGSTGGVKITGPVHSHLVFDIQGNDPNDGFYVRVPEILQVEPTVNKTAFVVKANGRVGIGTSTPSAKLEVDGNIISEEVKVQAVNPPDYVFSEDYTLRSLEETKTYITENKHLPEVPSAKQMEANGIELGKMNMLLLKKIEELTLYQIELLEKLEAERITNDDHQRQLDELKK